MKTITIHDQEYALDALPPKAVTLLHRIHSAQVEIDRLEALLKTHNTIQCNCYQELLDLLKPA